MKPRLKMRLGDLLVQESIITEEQLQQALGEQRKTGHKLGRTLIELRSITETQLLQFLSQQLNLPLLDISKRPIPTEVVNLIPEVQARRFRALAVEDRGDTVLVAMSDPADLQALDHLESLIAPKKLSVAVAPEQQLLQAFDNLYRRTDQIAQIAGKLEEEYAADQMFDLASLTSGDSDNETTVVKLLQSIFEDAVQMRASDIHIEPGEKALRIRQRIDGQLHETILNEVNIAAALVLRLKLMAGLDISEKRLPQDGRFHMEIKGHKIDVRMSTMPIYHGESVVMRLLDQSAGLLTLNETGMPPHILARIRKQIKRPHGMLLVTGPTGSGKTTTLYGILSELNTADRKIITVEDPVEYQLPRINQVQVNHKIGLDFSNVLRTTLRQDPDIIMVGEIRDQDTANMAIQAALTGHLVLSTLHTNDAPSSLTRLHDLGVQPFLTAATILGVLAQRLVRKLCPHCKQESFLNEQEWQHLATDYPLPRPEFVFKAVGCEECRHTGYKGRIGIYEFMPLSLTTKQLIGADANLNQLRQQAKKEGVEPLRISGARKILEGVTTLEEVLRVVPLN